MPDLLAQASEWLEGMRTRFATTRVIYCRGGASTGPIPATVGKSTFDQDEGDRLYVREESRDYLILASDLGAMPQAGDRIVEATDGPGPTYEVMTVPGEGPWRWSDPYRRTVRIHTKFVGFKAA